MSCGKLLLFGDSIIEYAFNTKMKQDDDVHYFALGPALCNAYTRKLDIIQRGFAGYNSRWALRILPSVLSSESNVVMATIFFGSNDAVSRGPQHIPLPEYESNIRKMVSLMKAKGIKPILIGPAMPDQIKWGKLRPESIKNNYLRTIESFKTYSDVAAMIAREENVAFVNLNRAFVVEGGENWRSLLCDGLHFSGKGYEVFYNELMKVIESYYPEYSPESLPLRFPLWRDAAANPALLDQ